jgi:2-dehydropantoate 2-reductase
MVAPKICIVGVGHIGGYVGGILAAAGHDVRFLARSPMASSPVIREIRAHGLRLTSFDGISVMVPAERVAITDDVTMLARADLLVVAVKSHDTAAVADTIARHGQQSARVVSLQNGVGKVALLRQKLPRQIVLGGMVPFNVTAPMPGLYHRATSGDIVIETDQANTAAQLTVSGLTVRASPDMVGVQWGKLLINLNNALNALGGLPLRDQLSQRPWRLLFAGLLDEALAVMKAEGIRPRPPTPVPAWLLPHILRLPDAAFRRIATRMINIDPYARSSMWDDLERRRPTEIDDLQGVIIALAAKHHISVPLNLRVAERIKHAEAAGRGSPALTPDQILTP